MKKSGQNKIIIVAGALVVVACFFAVYLRLFTNRELWYESFAAILGVIITAVITLLLLKGQSNNDVEKEARLRFLKRSFAYIRNILLLCAKYLRLKVKIRRTRLIYV